MSRQLALVRHLSNGVAEGQDMHGIWWLDLPDLCLTFPPGKGWGAYAYCEIIDRGWVPDGTGGFEQDIVVVGLMEPIRAWLYEHGTRVVLMVMDDALPILVFDRDEDAVAFALAWF